MIILLTLIYLGCVLLAFKVIKIKPTAVSIAVASLLGVVLLGGIVILWKQAAPMTQQLVLRRHVLQVAPDVREFVSKVHVKPNAFVRKGDPLFEIKSDRFQDAVDQTTAQLAAAKSTVTQQEAALWAAQAAVKKSEADTAATKAELDTALGLQSVEAAAVAKLKVEQTQQAYRAARADDRLKKASLKQAEFALSSAKHSVTVAETALKSARFNLERCTYKSPVDGQVVNWQIREQVPMARWRFTANGTIQDFSDTAIIAVFPQNLLKNVKAGNEVELAFKRRPGEILVGRVELVAKYTGEGQFMPSPQLFSAADVGSKGMLAARIRINDDELARELPLGAAGAAAIYTDFGRPFHIITKITVRISSWMNYLPF